MKHISVGYGCVCSMAIATKVSMKDVEVLGMVCGRVRVGIGFTMVSCLDKKEVHLKGDD